MAPIRTMAQRELYRPRSLMFRKFGMRPKSTYIVKTSIIVRGFLSIMFCRLRQKPPTAVSRMLIIVPTPA